MLDIPFTLITVAIINLKNWLSNLFTRFTQTFIKYNSNIKMNELIYFDFETTGLNPYHERIIEYAFLIDEEHGNETYIQSLVNPQIKMDKKITDITGIHPDMLEHEKPIKHHIQKIYNFINGEYDITCMKMEKKYLVAHNALVFDRIFLLEELSKLKKSSNQKITLDNIYFIDSLLLARKLIPGLYSYSIKSLAKHFNVSNGTHRALDDVLALKKIFEHLLVILSNDLGIPIHELKENPHIILSYYESYE
jgi:DNA polymerase III alpha subunit (gram-positive type)